MSLTCCTVGCRLPVARSAGECHEECPGERVGSPGHMVLSGVSCWEQVLLRNVFCESPGCTAGDVPAPSWELVGVSVFVGSSELRLLKTQINSTALLLSCSLHMPSVLLSLAGRAGSDGGYSSVILPLIMLQGGKRASPESHQCLSWACAQPRGKGPFAVWSFSLS